MASLSKRPKLDSEESEDDCKEQERNQLVQVHQLFPLDDPVKEDKEYSSLDSLPKEIIQEICMLLSLRDKMSLRLVNRQLYTICSDPYLWTNVFIDDAYHKANAPFIKSVLKTCQPHVQSLSLKGQLPFSRHQYQPKIISKILNCKNVHTLNLYEFKINTHALEKISSPSYLPHLQCLTLTFNERKYVEVLGAKFSCLSHLKKLVVIVQNISGELLFNKWLENKCIPPVFIGVGCYNKYNRNRDTPLHCPITHSAHFVAYERYRRPLNFDFYDIPLYSLQLGPNNSETVAMTANGELMITLKDFVTPTTQPNYDGLSQQYAIFNNEDIPPGLPVYTSRYGVNLAVLGFESVTLSLESFRLIVKDAPNLLEVSFRRSTLSDCLDAYLAPLSEHCLKLRGLNASSCFYSAGGSFEINVEHFWYLLSKMKNLEFLSVSCCSLIPPITHSPSSSQKEGGLSQVSHLPDIDSTARDNMINYIKSMSRLKGLDVTFCDFSLCTIFESSANVHLSHHYLLPFVSNLKSLVYLKVYFPHNSSHASQGLEEVLQNCQQLLVVSISYLKHLRPVNPALCNNLIYFSCDGSGIRIDKLKDYKDSGILHIC
uniref:F-box domain-containing protein n=1 Tax=Amphimedon queenslandica TaxID=400682 RepID=A0A1X7VN97_AMPQE